MILIEIINDYSEKLEINSEYIKLLYKEILYQEKINIYNISLILTNRNYLNKLKRKYLKKDHYTDVIAFNLNDKDEDIIGEIYVSIDDIKYNSIKFKNTFDKEFKRIIIHGLLHIIGYKDKTDSEKKKMTNLEDRYMLLTDKNIVNQ